jgi:hypothetical protein
MNRKVEDFQTVIRKEVDRVRRASRHPGYSEYGSKVVPLIDLYRSLTNFEEKKAFRDALESALTDDNEDVRSFAVDLCLGFVVFG